MIQCSFPSDPPGLSLQEDFLFGNGAVFRAAVFFRSWTRLQVLMLAYLFSLWENKTGLRDEVRDVLYIDFFLFSEKWPQSGMDLTGLV